LGRLYFFMVKYLSFHNSCFAFKRYFLNVNGKVTHNVTHPLFHNLWGFFFWGGIEIKELRPKFLEIFIIKNHQRISEFPEIMGQELIIDWFLDLLRIEITYHI
jgi:hypothetical protein